jgi:hypothetical protein
MPKSNASSMLASNHIATKHLPGIPEAPVGGSRNCQPFTATVISGS